MVSLQTFGQGNIINSINGTGFFKPPYSTKFSDWTNPATGGNINLSLMQLDNDAVNADVFISVTVAGQAITLQTPITAAIPAFSLRPGLNQLSGSDLATLFDLNNLVVTGINRQSLRLNNSVPAGLYTFTFRVYDYQRRDQELATPIIIPNVPLTKTLPPILNLPEEDATIFGNENTVIQFNWQSVSNPTIRPLYNFKLVEVPDGMDPNQAINGSGTPLYSFDFTITTFNYNQNFLPALTQGKTYAWRVEARDPDGAVEFENFGLSEVRSFYFGKPYMNKNEANLLSIQPIAPLHNEVIPFEKENERVELSWSDFSVKKAFDYPYNKVVLVVKEDLYPGNFQWKPTIIEKELSFTDYNNNVAKFKTPFGLLSPYKKYSWTIEVYIDNKQLENDGLGQAKTRSRNDLIYRSQIRSFSIAEANVTANIKLKTPRQNYELGSHSKYWHSKDYITFSCEYDFKAPSGTSQLKEVLKVYDGAITDTSKLGNILPIFTKEFNKNIDITRNSYGAIVNHVNVTNATELLADGEDAEAIGTARYDQMHSGPFSDNFNLKNGQTVSWQVELFLNGRKIGASELRQITQNFLTNRKLGIESVSNSIEAAKLGFFSKSDAIRLKTGFKHYSKGFAIHYFKVNAQGQEELVHKQPIRTLYSSAPMTYLPAVVRAVEEPTIYKMKFVNYLFGIESDAKYIQVYPELAKINIINPQNQTKYENILEVKWEPLKVPIKEYNITLERSWISTQNGVKSTYWLSHEPFTETFVSESNKFYIPKTTLAEGGRFRLFLTAKSVGANIIKSDTVEFILTKGAIYGSDFYTLKDSMDVFAFNGKRAFTKAVPPKIEFSANTGRMPKRFLVEVKNMNGEEWFTKAAFNQTPAIYQKVYTNYEHTDLDQKPADITWAEWYSTDRNALHKIQLPLTSNGDSIFNFVGVNQYHFSVSRESPRYYEDFDGTFKKVTSPSSLASFYTVGGNVIFTKAGPVFVDLKDVSEQQGLLVVGDGTKGLLKTFLNPEGVEVTLTNVGYDAKTQNLIKGEIKRVFEQDTVFETYAGRFEYNKIEINAAGAKIDARIVVAFNDVFLGPSNVEFPRRSFDYVHAQNGFQDTEVTLPNDLTINFSRYAGYQLKILKNSVVDANPDYKNGASEDGTNLKGVIVFPNEFKNDSGATIAVGFDYLQLHPLSGKYLLNHSFESDFVIKPLSSDLVQTKVKRFTISATKENALFAHSKDFEVSVNSTGEIQLNLDSILPQKDQGDLVFHLANVSLSANYDLTKGTANFKGFKGDFERFELEIKQGKSAQSGFSGLIELPAFDKTEMVDGLKIALNADGKLKEVSLAAGTAIPFTLQNAQNSLSFVVQNADITNNKINLNGSLNASLKTVSGQTSTFEINHLNNIFSDPKGNIGVNNNKNAFLNLPFELVVAIAGIDYGVQRLFFGNILPNKTGIGIFGKYKITPDDVAQSESALWFKSVNFSNNSNVAKVTQPTPSSSTSSANASGGGSAAQPVLTNQNPQHQGEPVVHEIPDMQAPILQVDVPGLDFAAQAIHISNDTYGQALLCNVSVPFDFFGKGKSANREGINFSYLMGEAPGGFDYWFAEYEMAVARTPITLPGKIELVGFVGRIFHKMSHTGDDGLGDIAYIPNNQVGYGGYGALTFRDGYSPLADQKGKFLIAQAGIEMSFTNSGTIHALRLDGYASLGNLSGSIGRAADAASGFTIGAAGSSADFGSDAIRNFDGLLSGDFSATYNFTNESFDAVLDVTTDGAVVCGGGKAEMGINHSGYDYYFRLGKRTSPIGLKPCLVPVNTLGWLDVEKRATDPNMRVSVGLKKQFDIRLSTGKVGIGITTIEAYAGAHLSLLAEGVLNVNANDLELEKIAFEANAHLRAGIRYLVLGDWRTYGFEVNANAQLNLYFDDPRWDASATTRFKVWSINRDFTVRASGNGLGVLEN